MFTRTSQQRAFNKLKADRCFICGENRIPALRKMEEHHIMAKKEGFTEVICRNCHAVLEDEKQDWNEKLLEEKRSSYHRCLAFLMGFLDTLRHLINSFIICGMKIEEQSDRVINFPAPGMKLSQLLIGAGITGIIFVKLLQDVINNEVSNATWEETVNQYIKENVQELNILYQHLRGVL